MVTFLFLIKKLYLAITWDFDIRFTFVWHENAIFLLKPIKQFIFKLFPTLSFIEYFQKSPNFRKNAHFGKNSSTDVCVFQFCFTMGKSTRRTDSNRFYHPLSNFISWMRIFDRKDNNFFILNQASVNILYYTYE